MERITLADEMGNETNNPEEIGEKFCEHFISKIDSLKKKTTSFNGNYGNRIRKLEDFKKDIITLDIQETIEILSGISNKKCKGIDGIPMRLFKDAKEILAPIITRLFNIILTERKIPEIWKQAKVIPLFKKGDRKEISNYRPVSNLCSISKIFEKVILRYIEKIQNIAEVDMTGEWQYGFIKGN